MAIRLGIGNIDLRNRRSSFSWSSYWTHQSNLWLQGRSELTMTDVINGNNAAILPRHDSAVGSVGGTQTPNATVANFGNVASGFIECKIYINKADTYYYIFSSARRTFQAGASYKYFSVAVLSSKPTIRIRDDNTGFDNNIQCTSAVPSNGWYTLKFISTGSAYAIEVNGVNQALTVVSGANDGKWMSSVTNRENIFFGYVYAYNSINSQDFAISYCNFNDTNKWYFTGGKYKYDVIGTTHATVTAGSVTTGYSSEATSALLDSGYSVWKKTGELDEYVPYKNGNPYDVSALLVGYSKLINGVPMDYPGSLTTHNLAISLLDFDPLDATPAVLAVLDRSNATYQNAASRAASDYDAANVYRYLASTVADPRILTAYFNSGYAGMPYQKITTELIGGNYCPKTLDEFMLTKTDHVGADQYRLMGYCGTQVFAI